MTGYMINDRIYELSNEQYNIYRWGVKGKEWDFIDGEFVWYISENDTPSGLIKEEIRKIQEQLKITDYITCKLIEAETDEERQAIRTEYADVLAQRRLWRARINELQQQLESD